MAKLLDRLGKRMIIGDGAMGTLLQNEISGEFVPDELNVSRPRLIEKIHAAYARAGAEFLTSNTFGASPLRLRQNRLEAACERINRSAVRLARRVADRHGLWVAGDIGPCGQLVQPLGALTFAEAVANFRRQAELLAAAGVDFLLLETISDLQEFRAAVIGILEGASLPLLASMSFSDGERSLTGTDGAAFAGSADFPGVVAIGSNCGTSPEANQAVVAAILRHSALPVFTQPNAGLPRTRGRRAVYNISPSAFADRLEPLYRDGVALIGSCCGSTPDFTRELARRFAGKPVLRKRPAIGLRLSTRSGIRPVERNKIFIVGERINPSGRKKLQAELAAGQMNLIRSEAVNQERAGCDALDVNVNVFNLPTDMLQKLILALQNIVSIPLIIDSTDPALVETYCRAYAGKGCINSISAEARSLGVLLPLARKYNMAFIASLLDERGVPATPRKRLAIARKIAAAAESLCIPRRHIIFDPLVLAAGAEPEKAAVTLQTIRLLRKRFPDNSIIIGLSNISQGLPRRDLLNATFLSLAIANGLDMVLANVLDEIVQHHILTLNFLLSGSRSELRAYVARFADAQERPPPRLRERDRDLYARILEGDVEGAREAAIRLSETQSPLRMIGHVIKPAMAEVGSLYQSRKYFLPQLIASAEAVKAILPVLKERLPHRARGGERKVLLATVRGDIHDIGKNIVAAILESFNYTVLDLGKDVPAERIVRQAVSQGVDAIGLSALMTTTVPALLETARKIRRHPELKRIPLFIGGAVLNAAIADQATAFFGRDGVEMAEQLKNFFLHRKQD